MLTYTHFESSIFAKTSLNLQLWMYLRDGALAICSSKYEGTGLIVSMEIYEGENCQQLAGKG